MWYNLNPLYYLLGVIIFSCIFTLFWDNLKCACGFAGTPAADCKNLDELGMAEVRDFFAREDIASLLKEHKNYIGTVVRSPEENGVVVTFSVYDPDKEQPVKSQCYKARKLDRELRQNFGAQEMIVMP